MQRYTDLSSNCCTADFFNRKYFRFSAMMCVFKVYNFGGRRRGGGKQFVCMYDYAVKIL